MSELKAISGHEIREDIDYNTRGIDPEDKEWHNYGKELCDTLYYRKSETDKVIAEKDAIIEEQAKEIEFMHQHCKYGEHCGTSCGQIHGELILATMDIAELKKACNDKDDWCLHTLKELRHQKYKRCLAMAYWCSTEYETLVSTWEFKIKHYKKWHERWLKLAEKFKPNKEANDGND